MSISRFNPVCAVRVHSYCTVAPKNSYLSYNDGSYRYLNDFDSARLCSTLPSDRIEDEIKFECEDYRAPSILNAPSNSLTAVGTSSKFRADIAHRACFWAFIIASSSVV